MFKDLKNLSSIISDSPAFKRKGVSSFTGNKMRVATYTFKSDSRAPQLVPKIHPQKKVVVRRLGTDNKSLSIKTSGK